MRKVLMIIGLAFLAGCASIYGNTSVMKQPLTSVTYYGYTKYRITKVKDSTNQVPERFLVAIKLFTNSKLSKVGLLAQDDSQSTRDVEIVVTSYRMRGSLVRFFGGALSGQEDRVESTVTVRDAKSLEAIGEVTVTSHSRLAIGNEDSLAEMHAEEIANFLGGGKTNK